MHCSAGHLGVFDISLIGIGHCCPRHLVAWRREELAGFALVSCSRQHVAYSGTQSMIAGAAMLVAADSGSAGADAQTFPGDVAAAAELGSVQDCSCPWSCDQKNWCSPAQLARLELGDMPAFVAADTSFVELQGIAADPLIQQDGVAGGPRKAWGKRVDNTSSVDSPSAGS